MENINKNNISSTKDNYQMNNDEFNKLKWINYFNEGLIEESINNQINNSLNDNYKIQTNTYDKNNDNNNNINTKIIQISNNNSNKKNNDKDFKNRNFKIVKIIEDQTKKGKLRRKKFQIIELKETNREI